MNIVGLQKRIQRIEHETVKKNSFLITVFYKDGTKKQVFPMQAVLLSLSEGDSIDHFEEDENSNNGGIAEGLANILLE